MRRSFEGLIVMIVLGWLLRKGADGVRGVRRREDRSDTNWRVRLAVDRGIGSRTTMLRSGEFRGKSGTLARSPWTAGRMPDRSRRGRSAVSRGIVLAALPRSMQ